MEYFIVKAATADRLVERVTAMLELGLGWEPAGGVSIGKASFGSIQFHQAMVRRVAE